MTSFVCSSLIFTLNLSLTLCSLSLSLYSTDTPTSLVLKDFVNHELVPILTMDPNARLAPVYSSATASSSSSSSANPADAGMDYSSLLDGSLGATGTAQSPGQAQVKGVYTLAEETELELQAVHTETQVERV